MNLRDLKQEINRKAIEEYKVKTNFSSCEFLIELKNWSKLLWKCLALSFLVVL